MFFDMPEEECYNIADFMEVLWHGMSLDIPMTGYILLLPFLLCIVTAFSNKDIPLRHSMTIYNAVIATILSTTFFTDLSLYPFWKFKLDATIFFYISSPKEAFASVSLGYIVLRLALAAIYAITIFYIYKQQTPRFLPAIKTIGKRTTNTLFLLFCSVPLAISIRGGLSESTANIGKAFFSEKEFLNHAAVNPCFSLLYSLDKADNYGDEFNFYDESERNRLFSGLYTPTPTDTTRLLNTTRPNIIIILLEGFGGEFTEIVGGKKNITPQYNKLAKEGIIFTNCYSNSFRTDRGMVSTLGGYQAFPTQSVMKLPIKSRTLPCIAGSLNEQGYKSTFLYGGDINFTNMQSYLRTGGYSTIISDADFTTTERGDNSWGVNDHITFGRLYELAVNQPHNAPWHIGYLTLSSHEPWTVPYNKLKDKIPNAFAYTDHCLGNFVEKIRHTPIWDNLLIICIPDHGVRYYDGMTHEQHHHNTMLWTGGAVKQHFVVNTLMSQSDMAATLLGQLGMPHDQYVFSRDIFSNEYQKYPFAFFTFKEGIGFRDSTGFTVYDLIGDKVIENKGPQEKTRVSKAKAILQSIYDDLGAR